VDALHGRRVVLVLLAEAAAQERPDQAAHEAIGSPQGRLTL
jgi:hypothetical protein